MAKEYAVPFEFAPRWREEFDCSCPLGSFVLEMTMGVDTVYLPSAERWAEEAPEWARPLWETLHEQLVAWCRGQRIPLRIEETPSVYPTFPKPE